MLLGCTMLLTVVQVSAWVFPEHRRITVLAIQQLNPVFKKQLLSLWAHIRQGHESRMSADPVDTTTGNRDKQLDLAAWPAIAGDHSCSSSELINTVTTANWILRVSDAAADLENSIAHAKSESKLENAMHYADMKLLRVDDAYASRAGANKVHFLLPRTSSSITADEYFAACMAADAPLNALGAYVKFHQAALQAAAVYAGMDKQQPAAQAVIKAVFSREAFALHFLQDAFAAGHIAGSWGKAALQKGTHDYYNKTGIEIDTWDDKRMVVKGDAYLDPKAAERIAAVVRKSLEQVISTASAETSPTVVFDTANDEFNVCKEAVNTAGLQLLPITREVLMQLPVPGLDAGSGQYPRFRSEIGPFIGISTSLNGMSVSGGFGKQQTASGYMGGLEGNLRFGVGLEGVLNTSGDGLMFLQLGWKLESASTNNIVASNASIVTNAITSAIPSRSAYNLRLRLPFYVLPGDMLLAAPVLALVSPSSLKKMLVTAVNGGAIPWQSGFSTGIGRFQFVLGREIGVSWYGLRNPRDFIILFDDTNGGSSVVEYRSTRFDFPILEYRPFRKFSEEQSSSVIVQLNAGVDIPHNATTIIPVGGKVPPMKNIWYAGIRVIFNWRQYL
jgi:hypothetical protein